MRGGVVVVAVVATKEDCADVFREVMPGLPMVTVLGIEDMSGEDGSLVSCFVSVGRAVDDGAGDADAEKDGLLAVEDLRTLLAL